MNKGKTQTPPFPASIFCFGIPREEKYAIMKRHADIKSQARVIAMYLHGAFEYQAMKATSEFIADMILIANGRKDAGAIEFIRNFINCAMMAFSKDSRNAFYRELMSRLDDAERAGLAAPFLWRIIPDFAARHLIKSPADAKKCECFNLFKGYHWCALLSARPEFEDLADKYDGFRKLIYFHEEAEDGSWHSGYTETLSYWGNLLLAQPKFKEKCGQYNGFAALCSESPDPLPNESLRCLVDDEPRRIQLIGYDDFELDENLNSENGWVDLLKGSKEFDAEFEEYQAYYSLTEDDWAELLAARPELERLKPAERDPEKYPSFDFSDSAKCENDEWNECDVGGIEKTTIIVNDEKINELWNKIDQANSADDEDLE